MPTPVAEFATVYGHGAHSHGHNFIQKKAVRNSTDEIYIQGQVEDVKTALPYNISRVAEATAEGD